MARIVEDQRCCPNQHNEPGKPRGWPGPPPEPSDAAPTEHCEIEKRGDGEDRHGSHEPHHPSTTAGTRNISELRLDPSARRHEQKCPGDEKIEDEPDHGDSRWRQCGPHGA